MAKKSMIAREIKRQKTVERFAAKRAELKKIIADSQSSDEDKFAAREKLQKLPWKFLQFLSCSKLIFIRRLRIGNYFF